jgi:hypothetical protein
MPVIPYSSTNFPQSLGPQFQGSNDLACSWAELLWSAITVGKANRFDLVRFGRYSYFEIVFRACTIYANLIERLGGGISRSSVYNFADPSEKGGISYFLGLTSAKLMASRLLRTPALMHLDVYRDKLRPILGNSSIRPDLVGIDSQGQWVIIEAKGRTGKMDPETMAKAKRQTQNLTTINGQVPAQRIALGSYFVRDLYVRDDRFAIAWEDPTSFNEEFPDIPLFPDEFISDYYKPFLELFRNHKDLVHRIQVEDEEFLELKINEADIVVGINSRLLGLKKPLHGFLDIAERMERLKKHSDANVMIGKDGISIRIGESWQGTRMLRDTRYRSGS